MTADISSFDVDRILCECEVDALRTFVERVELRRRVVVARQPSVCMTMVLADDSLEHQKFFMGEALTTECEVSCDDAPGYGVCIGDEPVRAYCLAIIDALLHSDFPPDPELQEFLDTQHRWVSARDTQEFNLVLRTQVDFKLMEEE